MSREVYKVTLIDGEDAFIFVEQSEETDWDVVDRLMRTGVHPPYHGFSDDVIQKNKGKTWKYTIQIGTTALYGKACGSEKRHALKHAWEQLAKDEGIKPGTTIESA